MNGSIKTFAVLMLVASAAAMIALMQPRDERSPDGLVRAHLASLAGFQSGEVVLDEAEVVAGWDTAPKRFAVVRTFARRLGNGAPDRGQSKLIVVHDSGEIVASISFSQKPKIEHDGRHLRINSIPAIAFATPADAFALSTISYGDLLAGMGAAEYGEEVADLVLRAFQRDGRDAVNAAAPGEILRHLASDHDDGCSRPTRIEISDRLPAKIAAFDIGETTLAETNVPNLMMSETWETTIDASVMDADGVARTVRILVVGDSCDRDRIGYVVIN